MERNPTSHDVAVHTPPPATLQGARETLALLPVRQAAVGAAKVLVALALLARPPGPTLPVIVLLTVAVYAHNDLTDLAEDGVNEPGRTSAVRRRRHALRLAVAGAVAIAVGVAATGGADALAVALVPLVLGACYNAPIVPGPGPSRLKDVLVLNTAATAAAWAVPVALLPVAFAGTPPGPTAAVACGYVLVRTFVASEFANVPDVAGDVAAGVRTLPVVLGETRTRWTLVGVNAVTAALLAAGAALGLLPGRVALALAPSLVLSTVVIAPPLDPVPTATLPRLADLEFLLAAATLWAAVA